MKKRNLFIILVLVLVFSMLAGCAPAAPAVEEEVEEPVEEVEEPAEEAAEDMAEEEEPMEEEEAAEDMAEEEEAMPAFDLDAQVMDLMASWEYYNLTNPKAVFEAQVDGEELFLIDAREVAELEEKGHIEGAVNIPLRTLAANLDKLPALDAKIVVYCGSGWRSTLGSTALGILGYTNVWNMVGGSFGGWVAAEYPIVEGVPAEAEALNAAEVDPELVATVDAALMGLPEGWGVLTPEALNEELVDGATPILIDVRKDAELAEVGWIDGAVHIQLEKMLEMKDQWPADLDADIVVYCKAGTRGNIAAMILRSYGYTNVRNLKGGFVNGWLPAGLPATGGLDNATADFLAGMEAYNTTNPAAVNEMMIDGTEMFLVDVREIAEVEEKGHIEGAIVVPLRTLGENIDKLPANDALIVVYCGSGWRSTLGMTALGLMGFTNVKTMVGGSYGGWVEAGFPTVDGLPAEAEALNAAEVDPMIHAKVSAALAELPEGWGVLTGEALNEEIIDGLEMVLVDVRKPAELEEVGFIGNSVHIQLEEMLSNKALWPAKDANVVVYCKAGTRGNIAAMILRSYGYTEVRNLKGGFIAGWSDLGFPVETGG